MSQFARSLGYDPSRELRLSLKGSDGTPVLFTFSRGVPSSDYLAYLRFDAKPEHAQPWEAAVANIFITDLPTHEVSRSFMYHDVEVWVMCPNGTFQCRGEEMTFHHRRETCGENSPNLVAAVAAVMIGAIGSEKAIEADLRRQVDGATGPPTRRLLWGAARDAPPIVLPYGWGPRPADEEPQSETAEGYAVGRTPPLPPLPPATPSRLRKMLPFLDASPRSFPLTYYTSTSPSSPFASSSRGRGGSRGKARAHDLMAIPTVETNNAADNNGGKRGGFRDRLTKSKSTFSLKKKAAVEGSGGRA